MKRLPPLGLLLCLCFLACQNRETNERLARIQKKLDEIPKNPPVVRVDPSLTTAAPPDPGCDSFPAPVLAQKGEPEPYQISADSFVRYRLTIVNRESFPAGMFVVSPQLPPCGLNPNASRTWEWIYNGQTDKEICGFCGFTQPSDLDDLWFGTRKGSMPPATVYVTLQDRICGKTYRSNSVAVTPAQISDTAAPASTPSVPVGPAVDPDVPGDVAKSAVTAGLGLYLGPDNVGFVYRDPNGETGLYHWFPAGAQPGYVFVAYIEPRLDGSRVDANGHIILTEAQKERALILLQHGWSKRNLFGPDLPRKPLPISTASQ